MLDKVLRSVRFGNKVLNKIAGALFVVIGVVGGAWYGYSWFHDEAEKERARNGTAPKIVAIQDFKRGTDVGPADQSVSAASLRRRLRQISDRGISAAGGDLDDGERLRSALRASIAARSASRIIAKWP